jgi:hypothetical protein
VPPGDELFGRQVLGVVDVVHRHLHT